MVLTVAGPDTATAMAGARALAEAIERHPEVAWVRTGVDDRQMQAIYELYFPRRFYFLASDPGRIPELTSEAALREQAERARRDLALPTASLGKRLVSSDPLGSFRAILGRISGQQTALDLMDGQFVTRDGRFGVVFLGTRPPAFDGKRQKALLADLSAAFARVNEGFGGALVLEWSGANVFAVSTERSIRSDVNFVTGFSIVAVIACLQLFFGSWRNLLLSGLPMLGGLVAATGLGLLVFGRLDGLTLGFGAALIGVVIDYPMHLLSHLCFSPHRADPRLVLRRISPSIALGGLTTMASFAGLGLTSFPGFRQIAFFSSVGVGVALAITLWVLPPLVVPVARVPLASRVVSEKLGRRGARPGAARQGDGGAGARPGRALRSAASAARLGRRSEQALAHGSGGGAGRPSGPRARVAVGDRASRDRHRAGPRSGRGARRGRAGAARTARRDGGARRHSLPAHLPVARGSAARRTSRRCGRTRSCPPGCGPPTRRRAFAATPSPASSTRSRRSRRRRSASRTSRNPALADLVRPLLADFGGEFAVNTYLQGLKSPEAVRRAIEGLPGVHFFDQGRFLNEVYAEFRITTVRQIFMGNLLVIGLLLLRYRRLRPALAAFLPSVLVTLILLGSFAALGVETNLLHVVGLVMVLGMGVDYGVFLVDSASDPEEMGTTMLSSFLGSITTVLTFGVLALSQHPALRALGVTIGGGILLAFLLAPLALVVLRGRSGAGLG